MLEGGCPLGILQFLRVAGSELGEQFRDVAIPLPQSRGRGDGFAPFVQVSPVLAQSTRPEPVNQDPRAVGGPRLVVYTADDDRRPVNHRLRRPISLSGLNCVCLTVRLHIVGGLSVAARRAR